MTLHWDDLVMSPDMEMDEELFDYWKEWIEKASHIEMAIMERFAPGGHVLFNNKYGLYHLFDKKFQQYGGMTTAISKKIGHHKIFDVITPEQLEESMK